MVETVFDLQESDTRINHIPIPYDIVPFATQEVNTADYSRTSPILRQSMQITYFGGERRGGERKDAMANHRVHRQKEKAHHHPLCFSERELEERGHRRVVTRRNASTASIVLKPKHSGLSAGHRLQLLCFSIVLIGSPILRRIFRRDLCQTQTFCQCFWLWLDLSMIV